MVARIRDISKSLPRIEQIGHTLRRVDAENLAAALGATRARGSARRRGGVLSLLALGERIGALMRSTGGRPSLEGRARRQKIPITDAEWERLENLAERLESSGVRASAGQVASVLLHEALEQLDSGRQSDRKSKQTGASDRGNPRGRRSTETVT